MKPSLGLMVASIVSMAVMDSQSTSQKLNTNSHDSSTKTPGPSDKPPSCPVDHSFSPFLSKFAKGSPSVILTGDDDDFLTTRGFKNWVDYVLLLANRGTNILPPELNHIRNHFIGQKDYKLLYAGLTENYNWSPSPNCDNWTKSPQSSDPSILTQQAAALIGTNLVINDPNNDMKLIVSGQGRFDFGFLHHGFRPLINSWISSHNTRILLEKILSTTTKADAALNNRARDKADPLCGCAQVPKNELLNYLGLEDSHPSESPSCCSKLDPLQAGLDSVQKSLNDQVTTITEVLKVQADQAAQLELLLPKSHTHPITSIPHGEYRSLEGALDNSTVSEPESDSSPSFSQLVPCQTLSALSYVAPLFALPSINQSASALGCDPPTVTQHIAEREFVPEDSGDPRAEPDSLPDGSNVDEGSGHDNSPSSAPVRVQRSRLVRPSGTNFLRLSGRIGKDIALITRSVNAILSGLLANRRSLKDVHPSRAFNFSTEAPPDVPPELEKFSCPCDQPTGFIEENRATLLAISLVASIFSIAWTTFTCIAYLKKGYICNVGVAKLPPPTRLVIERDPCGVATPFLPEDHRPNLPSLPAPNNQPSGPTPRPLPNNINNPNQ